MVIRRRHVLRLACSSTAVVRHLRMSIRETELGRRDRGALAQPRRLSIHTQAQRAEEARFAKIVSAQGEPVRALAIETRDEQRLAVPGTALVGSNEDARHRGIPMQGTR